MKLGVIGVGNMGRHHARIYSELGVLAAISDVNENLAKKLASEYNCNYYVDYNEMLNIEKLDAVSVVVPTSSHRRVALDVISKGVNLLVEKPIADNIFSAKEIVDAAKSKGVKLMIGHIERFNPAVRKLKEIISQGRLGNINSVVAKRVGLSPPKVLDSNIIIDLAVHDIDIMSYLLEKNANVIACVGGVALSNGREDYAKLLLDFDGIAGFIQVNWITPIKIRQLAVTGTKGYAELNYISQKLVIYESNYEKEFDDFGDFVIKFSSPNTITIDMNASEPLKNELREFINCIKENKEPEVNGSVGLDVLRVATDALNKLRERNAR